MGFYDDIYEVNQSKKRREPGMGRLIMTSITSAVVGGMLVLAAVPMLTQAGYIKAMQPNTAEAATDPKLVGSLQPVTLNVDTGVVRAVEKVENAIVGITNIQRVNNIWTQESGSVTSGEGSGVIYEKVNGKAHIITNYHVIEGAERLEISLPGGDKVDAKVLGYDQLTDLAVLEIDAAKVKAVAELGDSKSLKVGEPAIAIGNPLGMRFSRTVTQGIISSLERSMPIDVDNNGQTDWELDVLQTDAAINPGNSGGALVNIQGQVIGINTLKISREGVEGLGFAIPINDVKNIVERLEKDGYLKRAYMGITPRDLTSVPRYAWTEELRLPSEVKSGVIAWNVSELSPASRGGLRQYDVITALDGKEVTGSAQLLKYLTINKKPGDSVEVTFYRDGFKKTIKVTLGESSKQ
ncbi:S1C family serine protease [Brevibacillus dissolubilis]|uniref:S1C family serine protease n=1 Tax=Brevibacillus dissolubilis TaxID=1844116 RepID=UPI0011166ED3|nr:trypsin-like peptidase domain-containing protein [Brevibacillus dissolubilis]